MHRSRQRRRTDWGRAYGDFGGTLSASSTTFAADWLVIPADTVDSGSGILQAPDQTLVRSSLKASPYVAAPSNAVNDVVDFEIAWGTIAFEAKDDTPPGSEVMLPIEDGYADWISHNWVRGRSINSTGATITLQFLPFAAGYELVEWSRAQRKLSANTGVLIVVELNNNGTIAFNYDFDFFWRGLFKLP